MSEEEEARLVHSAFAETSKALDVIADAARFLGAYVGDELLALLACEDADQAFRAMMTAAGSEYGDQEAIVELARAARVFLDKANAAQRRGLL